MGYYDLNGREAVAAIVEALGDEDLARRMDEAYRGRRGPEDQAVAQYVDRLLCVIQEAIGDPEVHWSGDYWTQAVESVEWGEL